MSQSRKAAKSIIIIIILSFGSKILGFFREVLIAAKFGSNMQTDAYFIAFTATGLFTSLITESLNTILIPVLSEVEAKEGKQGKKKHTNNLLNVVMLISIVIVTVSWIFAPYVIKILAHGFEGEQFDLAVTLMRIGLPVMIFSGIVGVLRGYLQSELMFNESAVAQYPYNLLYIFFLVFLSSIFGIKALMVISVLAVATQIIVQLPGVKSTGFKYNLQIDFKDKYVKKVMFLVSPILISVAINDFNQIIDRTLASTLVEGTVSALNYSNRLNSLILGIFITAITTVIFPELSKAANEGNYDNLKSKMRNGINMILLISIPSTVGIIILAEPIVKLAFERGAFDKNATILTSSALVFYSLGLVGIAMRYFLNRVYYSIQDTKTPMINGFIAVVINTVLNFILIQFMAHKGLALATSISAVVTSMLLLYGLRKKLGCLGTMKLIKCTFQSLFASVIMGAVMYIIYNSISSVSEGSTILEIITLLGTFGVAVIIYLFVLYLLKIDEFKWILGLLKKKAKNK